MVCFLWMELKSTLKAAQHRDTGSLTLPFIQGICFGWIAMVTVAIHWGGPGQQSWSRTTRVRGLFSRWSQAVICYDGSTFPTRVYAGMTAEINCATVLTSASEVCWLKNTRWRNLGNATFTSTWLKSLTMMCPASWYVLSVDYSVWIMVSYEGSRADRVLAFYGTEVNITTWNARRSCNSQPRTSGLGTSVWLRSRC